MIMKSNHCTLVGAATILVVFASLGAEQIDLPTGPYADVTFGKGLFVAAGAGPTVLLSGDGDHWVQRALPAGTPPVQRVFQLQDAFFALADIRILRSETAEIWEVVYEDSTYAVTGLTEGLGKLVATRGSDFLVSSNGLDWLPQASGISAPSGTTISLTSICFGNDLFVAVGFGPFGGGRNQRPPLFLSSTDGLSWQNRTPPIPTWLGDADGLLPRDVLFTGTRFIAVGANSVYFFGDAKAWFTSPDGILWELLRVPATSSLPVNGFERGTFESVTSVLGRVFASGWGWPGYYSLEAGDQWVRHAELPGFYHRFASGRGNTIVAGDDMDSSPVYLTTTLLLVSSDLLSWNDPSGLYSSPEPGPPGGILNLARGTPNLDMWFEGDVGMKYRIEFKNDPSAEDWSELSQTTLTIPWFSIPVSALEAPARIFRAVSIP
jgi:hypothetical protein